MIGEKDQLVARVGLDKANASQRPRERLARFGQRRVSDLIAAHAAAEDLRVGAKARDEVVPLTGAKG